tara:strand:- start:483 stop:881 length:399 start_codon:yes stop_codon:yes gene_type:complete
MNKYKNKTCLIVDDYNTARDIIKKSILEIGLNVIEAENGEQALSIITKKSLDLVISDYQMPLKNGLKLLENIRNDDVLNNIPFILMLIEPYEHIISQAKKLGMNDYIVKPFDVFTLSKVLDKVLPSDSGESL